MVEELASSASLTIPSIKRRGSSRRSSATLVAAGNSEEKDDAVESTLQLGVKSKLKVSGAPRDPPALKFKISATKERPHVSWQSVETTSPEVVGQLVPRLTLSPIDNVTVEFVFAPKLENDQNSSSDVSSDSSVPAGVSTVAAQALLSVPSQTSSDKAAEVPATPRSRRRREITNLTSQIAGVSANTEPEVAFSLEQFQWVKTVGTGTFGRVVLCQRLAQDVSIQEAGPKNKTKDKSYYAMKILRIADIFRLKQVEHIQNEKSILQSLIHPFIVRLFWTYHDSCKLYMLMEFAAGGELFTHLRSVGSFNSATALFYGSEILLALEYLHSLSIVYRDLKPENVIFDQSGHVKITDFGFAKYLTDRAWTLCGTPEYLAPEIIQSRGYNKAVDYWAFGILLYEMMAGHPPFFSENPIEIYQKILDGKVRWPKTFDLVAKDLIKKLLAADRTKRLGNMKNGADDIKAHRWFRSVNWSSCLNREIQPPHIPQVRHAGDASNFDNYSEEWLDEEESQLQVSTEQLDVFQDF